MMKSVLDHLERNRRRIRLQTKKKIIFLLDEKKSVFLKNGALLILANNYKIKVKAKNEDVLMIESVNKKKIISFSMAYRE